MSASACPRCQKTLPEGVLAEVSRGGTFCPFCSAPLKRAPRRSLDAPLTGDEGYASFELEKPVKVNTTPPPSLKPGALAALKAPVLTAAPKPAATAAAMPKSMRATMVGATIPTSDLPFNGTPALGSFSMAGPAHAQPVRGPAPPLPSAKPAAAVSPMAATMLAPPAPAAVVSPTLAPPAHKVSPTPSRLPPAPPPARLPLPGSVPAPGANGTGKVVPIVSMRESEPTRVSPPSSSLRASGAVTSPATATESEPTNVSPSPAEPAPMAPALGADESEPIMSVTLMPDSAPVVAPTSLQPVDSRRRGLALIGVGMGLAIVLLVFGGVKLLSGPKTTARMVAAPAGVPASAPVVEAVPAPAGAAAPASQADEAARAAAEKRAAERQAAAERRAARQQAAAEKRAAKEKAAAERRAAKLEAIAEKRAAKEKAIADKRVAKEQAIAEKRAAKQQAAERRASRQAAKAHARRSARGQKVAMQSASAKRSAPPPAPVERADPRPAYERGNALLLAGDGKAAIAAYREAVKSSPSDPIGFRGLGLAYEQQGETTAAIRALKRYLKLAPHADDHDLIAKRIDRLNARPKQK